MNLLPSSFYHWLIGCAAALLLTAPAFAQTSAPPGRPAPPPGAWTLSNTLDYALINNLGLQGSDLTSRLDVATLGQSRAAMLPAINGQATHTYQYGTSVDPVTYQFQSNTIRANNFSLNGSVPLYQGGVLRNTVVRNRLSAAASAQDLEKAKADLLLNVASGYLQVLLTRETLRAAELQRTTTTGQLEQAEKRLRAGAIAESNVLDVRAQVATEDLNVVTAQNNLTIAILRLEQQLNLDPAEVPPGQFQIAEPVIALPGADAPIDLTAQQVYDVAAGVRPELKAADLRLQAALKGVDVARGNYWPRLSFGASLFTAYSSQRSNFIPTGDTVLRPVGFGLLPGTTKPDITKVVYSFQPKLEQKPTNFTNQFQDNFGKQLGFTLTVPILNGLQVRTQVKRSQLQAQQAQLSADQVRVTLRQSIEQAVADAEAARRRYAAATRQREALDLSLRNADIRFANGLLNATDFNQIKNNRARAENDQIQAKYDFVFKRKVLDLYMGKPLEL
ncbi:MAG: TolC family protein [Hymenobacteraceae bacterium]|nr:TolC family protein [Hymenobacteraceae bacterium]